MKTEKNILIAFLLNLAFSVFEFFGGIVTGSVAIVSDAIHDIGDAVSIGIAYLLEKKSRKQPDEIYTYGYVRFSLVGGLSTTCILFLGSLAVIVNAISRLSAPIPIHYDGMIFFAIVGVIVNGAAVFFTRDGESLNQKAVNLHMLEDVLGWIVVLLGAVVMKLTGFIWLDAIMSMGVAAFILVHAVRNLRQVMELFLEKIPKGISVQELKEHVGAIPGVLDVHHLHVWSLDGNNNYATMHIVADGEPHAIKERIREELLEHGIGHVTLELESEEEFCHEEQCRTDQLMREHHHHHHH